MIVLRIAVLVLSFLLMGQTHAQESTPMTMDILRDKIKADKEVLVATNLHLTDAEAKHFWVLYGPYQKELGEIDQRLASTIKSYADAYEAGKGEISNDTAKKLLADALAVDEAEVKLRQLYAAKLDKVLPATKVARYLQIENKIRAIVKFDLAAVIPLAS
jgi:uncharacterized protein YwgA